MSSTRISFSYPQKMKDKLKVLAEKDCRTLSSYIQTILADHLDKNPVEEKAKKKPAVRKKASRRKRASEVA